MKQIKNESITKTHSDKDLLPKEKPAEKNYNNEYLT